MSKSKLNIIYLDIDDIKNPLLNGGQARATFEIGKRLTKLGHKLTVLSTKYPGYKDRYEEGIYYKHIGINTGNIRINNAFYILTLPFILPFLKADLIVECFTAPISTMFSPWFTKIPVIALPSSFEADRFSKLYHLPFNMIEKFGLRFYKYAIPLGKDSDDKIREVNSGLVSQVIPEGVGKEYFAIKKSKKAKHILFLGRFDVGQKGIDLLLEAYAKVADKIKYPLVVAGMGPDEVKVQELVKKYNLSEKVKLIGPTYGKKKFQVLADSLFVALPSRHETFSCFGLEALASGNGLVIFDISGLGWTNNKIALKARAFKTDDYAKKLLQMSDEKTAKQYGKNGIKFAKNFTWENVTNDFINFCQKVLTMEKTNTVETASSTLSLQMVGGTK